jgi:galactitol-specific phosphotransferase system IIB component
VILLYGAKWMLVGLLVGISIGSSSTIVQRHVKSMCDCTKQLLDETDQKIQDFKVTIRKTDLNSIKQSFIEKIEQLNKMLDEITSNLTEDEIKEKINEVKEKVETLFKEMKSNFSI